MPLLHRPHHHDLQDCHCHQFLTKGALMQRYSIWQILSKQYQRYIPHISWLNVDVIISKLLMFWSQLVNWISEGASYCLTVEDATVTLWCHGLPVAGVGVHYSHYKNHHKINLKHPLPSPPHLTKHMTPELPRNPLSPLSIWPFDIH